MFGNILPREGRFFDMFRESADLSVRAVAVFRKMIVDLPNAERYAREIKEIEHMADDVTHRTIELLHKTFITPLDREDIHKLICELDDVVDFIDAAAQRVSLYDIRTMTPEGISLADTCVKSIEQVRRAVLGLENLKNTKEIQQVCVEINRLENEADHTLRAGMARLFREETDTRQLIKLKELYELLETVTDRCEDVANIIDGIVLENG